MHALLHETGFHLTAQMALHILAMNVAAPTLVLLLRRFRIGPARGLGGLAPATALQLAAIWSAHAPVTLMAAQEASAAMLLIHGALFVASLWFWHEVVAAAGDRRWRSILALAITAKLFCLLGVLMVFAPRPLAALVADQQAAGLLMLVICPITYLLAAGIIAWRWLLDIEARPAQPSF